MDVEVVSPSLVSTTAISSLKTFLHPLVIINISEHYTRIKMNPTCVTTSSSSQPPQVLGFILGVQHEREIEIFNSFELPFQQLSHTQCSFDEDYAQTKRAQYKQVFEHLEIVGWYTTGDSPRPWHLEVQSQVTRFCESATLFMLVNTSPSLAIRVLPIIMYENVSEIVADKAYTRFVDSGYTLVTDEVELIAVDYVAKVRSDTSTHSEVTQQMSSMRSSLDMLLQRVKIIISYLQAVSSGELPFSHSIQREISCLCGMLPVLQDPQFQQTFMKEKNDALLIGYMATITKSCAASQKMLEKVAAVAGDRGSGPYRSRGPRGMNF